VASDVKQALSLVGGWLSQSEWMVRLLNLSRAEEPRTEPGLILIQVDGLGFTEFKRSLREGHMPFLKRLSRKPAAYAVQPHYAGIPSNTPGVQGELFYGVKACVAAFSFLDRANGKICHMFDPAAAQAVEERLQKAGEPLLAGGSSYGNIFSGGAKEAHFCSTSMGWAGLIKALNPVALALMVVLNLHIVFRAAVLTVLEVVLAAVDSMRGIFTGRGFQKELGFIPLRVAICIVLREVVTAAARIDIARGVRVIHVNLAGYDEQAHHRGPSSAFARWTLNGIDSTIRRIWRAAKHATRRDYTVWIYSDHGQEDTVPYPLEHGVSVREAVSKVFDAQVREHGWHVEQATGIPHWRSNLLSPHAFQADPAPAGKPEKGPRVLVAAMGPVGHIYFPEDLNEQEAAAIAEALVNDAKIPLVLRPDGKEKAHAWTPDGAFSLPEDAKKILGEKHPYLKEVADDLVHLCQHADAGTFVISGWRVKGKPGSFPMEFGAHAGPGREETNGFVYVPEGALTPPDGREFVRNEDIRKAARRILANAAP
jgi:hypothetical protein